LLSAALTARGIDLAKTPILSPVDQSPAQATEPLPPTEDLVPSTNGDPSTAEESKSAETKSEARPEEEHNAAALKHLTHGIPSSLNPFFSGSLISLSS
jgi:E3 ubiquitin-protein ligase HUWE1